MPSQVYKLTIKSADGTTDALVVTSIRGGTNPYIANVPSGDGQEVDLLTGAVRTGSYVVEVVDVATGTDGTGTIRLVTSRLYDANQPNILSRAAFVEMSEDNGSTWTVWQSGYLTSVRQIDAIRYAFDISNTRRVEQTKQLFTWSDSKERINFPKRGCVIGGPVIGGFGVGGDRATDSGGWEFAYLNTTGSAAAPKQGDILALEYRAGYFWPEWSRKTIPGPGQATDFWNIIAPYRDIVPGDKSIVGADFNGLNDQELVPSYPQLTAIFSYTVSGTTYTMYGKVRAFFTDYKNTLQQNAAIWLGVPSNRWLFGDVGGKRGRLFIELDAKNPNDVSVAWNALPSANAIGRVRLVASQVDEGSPIYIDDHPVEIAKLCYDVINIAVDTTSYNTVRQIIGDNARVAMRISKPVTMAEFLETSIFGPFGFAARTTVKTVAGVVQPVVEFFSTRYLSGSAPAYTITSNDLVGDQPPQIFDINETTVVTSFVVEQQTLFRVFSTEENNQTPPPDGIVAIPQAIQLDNGDTSTFSTRVVEYKIPGMVHDAANWATTIRQFANGVALEGFGRFGRGAPSAEVQILRTSAAAAAQIGDLIYISVDFYPNKNYRIGESSVGARVAQIVRRDEFPEGPKFKLVDAGVYNQPATAATISIAKSASDPRRVAQFTLTNAATLNTNGAITVAVEYAVATSTPTGNGLTFTRYSPGNIPTFAIKLPAVTPGSTVYVRARSEQAGRFPSAWSAWTSVALDSWVAPTSLTASSITNGSVALSWSIGANTSDAVDVFIAPGSVAPSSWQSHRINSLPAGSTSTVVSMLLPSTAYIAAVAFRDSVGDTRGTVATATFSTTGSTSGTASRPAGIAVIAGINDAALQQGVALALWQAAGADVIVIERAPDSGGSPGTYAEIAAMPSYTEVYVDYLPRTSIIYWYRIQHRRSGQANSTYTPGVSAVVTGVPANVVRPDAVNPVIIVTTGESGSTATVTLDITDSQNRVTQVRFRERTNNGAWSAWTVDTSVPYSDSATIPATGFVEIEYEVTGYNAAGASGVLAGGVEAFDADTNATIVSASGTFSLAGALTLGIQGDTDTNSFRYAVATTNWANDAAALTAATGGTLVSARNATVTLTGPYAVGTTVYLAIAGYNSSNGTGTAYGPFRYSFLNGARDTIPLLARARLFSMSATQAVIRVAVACPIAPSPNSANIAYSLTDLSGVTPATNQTVTPELSDTITEAAGTFADFTVPRPAANAVPGRITFLVTATGRVAATDAADITPQNPPPASLTVNYTASDTEYVITWSVGTADTGTLSIDGGAFSTPPASPITVARAPYKTGSDKVYTFKSVGPQSDVLTSSVTVSKQLPFVSDAADVTITGVVRDSATAATISWTFTDIPAGSTWTVNGRAFDVGSGNITVSAIALGTSPKTRQLTGFTGMGTGTFFRATVTAYDSGGAVVASDTFTTTF